MALLAEIDWAMFHFLRPQWLWGLLVLMPLALWVWAGNATAGAWKAIVDPALQPFMLTAGTRQTRWYKRVWLLLFWLLSVLALAGPTWEQRPTPLTRSEQARIVVLDLSRSMLANDMRPDRLSLARLKVQDLLRQSRDSKAGLVVFAAQAFPIAPLTDDIQTLAAQVPALHPDLMPAQGGRIDRALEQAMNMLKNGGAAAGGQVLLVTDSVPQEAAFLMAQTLRDNGYELSVLAIGTADGAPIPEDTRRGRGFVKDGSGNIVIAKLPSAELRQLALSGGGQFSLLTADDSDITKLTKPLTQERDGAESAELANAGDQWLEAGPYLLLLVLPLAALGFRRGWLMSGLLVLSVMQPPEVLAETEQELPSSWWLNADQLGKTALEAGDAEAATQLFESADWKAAAQYKSGQHQPAAEYWSQLHDAAAHYNRGNALAQTGKLQEAIEAWQQVPDSDALYESAQHNAKVIQALLDQQQQNQSEQNQSQQEQGENKDSDSQQSEPEESGQEQSPQDQPGQSQSGESESEPQPGEKSPQENQSQQSSQQSEASQPNPPPEAQEQNQQEAESQQPQEQASEAQSSDAQDSQPEEDSDAQAAKQGDETEQAATESDRQAALQQSAEEQAKEQALEQWLGRVPDDPGGLLRQKFNRDYQRRIQQRGSEYQDEEQAW